MGLTIPNLDDKKFDELVEETRSLIARFAPEWTDYNVHDPGITFIELYAWLAEMQIYQLNRVTDAHYQKFLKLLGSYVFAAQPARVDIEFRNVIDGITLSAHTPIATEVGGEKIVFETEDDLTLIAANLTKVLTKFGSQIVDNTKANESGDTCFVAFGEAASSGAELRMQFNQRLPEEAISIAFVLFEEDLSLRVYHDDEHMQILPSPTLEWQYLESEKWVALNVKEDTTLSLTKNGRVVLEGPPSVGGKEEEEKKPFWIRCRLKDGYYKIPPLINRILLNTVSAVQMEKVDEYLAGKGKPEQMVKLKKTPFIRKRQKNLIIQVQAENRKWEDWKQVGDFESSGPDDPHYVYNQQEGIVVFGDGLQGRIPSESQRIRAVYEGISDDHLEAIEYENLGTGCGIPGQIVQLKKAPVVRKDQRNLIIKVQKDDSEWEDWRPVNDFGSSGPDDPDYVFNQEEGIIVFGNGLNGRIPLESRGIKVSYKATVGAKGNIPRGQKFWIREEGFEGIFGTNLKEATGGAAGESIEQAKTRTRRDFGTRFRAVTLDDYEKLARSTPGLKVVRAKAIPNYNPDYPCVTIPGAVTVVVVPYARKGSVTPSLGRGFCRAILAHLNRHRLVTTDVSVIEPEYVKIIIKCKIHMKKKNSTTEVEQRVMKALQDFLDPLPRYPEKRGWPFGRPVYLSEIYQVLDKVEGVDYATDVCIDAEEKYSRTKDVVKIPAAALAYSGKHQVKIVGER